MSNLLVVDWDFFFPNPAANGVARSYLYDWGTREAPLFIDFIWGARAAAFLHMDGALPYCRGYEHFWERFRLPSDVPLLIADSNKEAGLLGPDLFDDEKLDQVWLFDAHHDCGYDRMPTDEWLARGTYTCEDWMLKPHLLWGAELHVRYPQWRNNALLMEPKPLVPVDRRIDDGQPIDVEFAGVFVCRSGAWVPSWCDKQFEQFLGLYPGEDRAVIDNMQMREFSLDAAQAEADRIRDKAGPIPDQQTA